MVDFVDGYWWSKDGLRLHYRDYPADEAHGAQPPLLCLPGLTRNARDFQNFAERYAGRWRVICLEMRGRAESAYSKDPMTYVPLIYVQDVEQLLIALAIDRFVAIGTSLGGIITMLMASTHRDRLAGAIINDIGPDIEPKGLERIRAYVGTGNAFPTWVHTARALAESATDTYPDYNLQDWLAMAKRLYRLNSSGRIVLDYDMRIAEPFKVPGSETGVDMWPVIACFRDIPTLILRGELSDIMSEATALRMGKEIGAGGDVVTVPRVGHAPTLDEPEAVTAINRLLKRVAENA